MSSQSNDEHLSKAKDEIRAQAQLLPQRPLLSRQAPPKRAHATPNAIERDRLDYPIGELTDLHYLAFIESAFRAILKRAPDEGETQTQLAALAAGGTKAEVLGNLRYSPEGRRVGTRIGGLLPRYALAKAVRVPVLGYLLQLGSTAAALPLLARHQRASDMLAAARDHDLRTVTHELSVAHSTQRAMLLEIDSALGSRIGILHETATALRSRVGQLEATTSAYAGRFEELAFLRQRVYAMNHWSHHLTAAFARIEEVADAHQVEQGALAARAALEVVAADTLRNARNLAWADAFASSMPARGRVLALACGGDWLALLAARGFGVSGAEPNPALREAGCARGVTIESAAAQAVLRRTADASLDGLTILALPALQHEISCIQLLAEAHRVLRNGGTLLLAFAREAAAIVDALLGASSPTMPVDLLTQAVATTGFADITRIDADDGSVALLARSAS